MISYGKHTGAAEKGMEEGTGIVKHILLGKFKDGLSEEQVEEYIKGYASLVNLVPSMKAFRWYFHQTPISIFSFTEF